MTAVLASQFLPLSQVSKLVIDTIIDSIRHGPVRILPQVASKRSSGWTLGVIIPPLAVCLYLFDKVIKGLLLITRKDKVGKAP